MWYPIIFVLAVFLLLVLVVRRALWLGPAEEEQEYTPKAGAPDDMISTWEKAEYLYNDRKYFAAEKWFRDVVHHQPDHDKAWARLGVIALSQKRYRPAIEALQKSIVLNPNIPSRYYNLSLAYLLIDEFEDANNAIDKALADDPNRDNYKELKQKIKLASIKKRY